MNAAEMQPRLAVEVVHRGEPDRPLNSQPAQSDSAVRALINAVASQQVERQVAAILDVEAAVASSKGS